MFTRHGMRFIWALPSLLVVCLLLGTCIRALLGQRLRRPLWIRNILDHPPDPLRPADAIKRRLWVNNPLWQILMIVTFGFVMQIVKYNFVLRERDWARTSLRMQLTILLPAWV